MNQMWIFAGEVGHTFAWANTERSFEFQKSAKKSIMVDYTGKVLLIENNFSSYVNILLFADNGQRRVGFSDCFPAPGKEQEEKDFQSPQRKIFTWMNWN